MNSFALILSFVALLSYVDCCNETNNEESYFCMNCRRTCQTAAKADEEPPVMGCGCKNGFIMDERINTCVTLNEAPKECNVTDVDYNFGFIYVDLNETIVVIDEDVNTTESVDLVTKTDVSSEIDSTVSTENVTNSTEIVAEVTTENITTESSVGLVSETIISTENDTNSTETATEVITEINSTVSTSFTVIQENGTTTTNATENNEKENIKEDDKDEKENVENKGEDVDNKEDDDDEENDEEGSENLSSDGEGNTDSKDEEPKE